MGDSINNLVGKDDKANRPRANRFELAVAIMLGAASVLTASSGLQSSMWNGKMSEYYSLANQKKTAAAAENSYAVVTMSKDGSVDAQAKQLMVEADENPATKKRSTAIGAFLYMFQMSDHGYRAMGFSEELRKRARSSDLTEDDDLQIEEMLDDMMDMDLDQGLNEKYRNAMLSKSMQLSDESENTFALGVKANENGDRFGLVNVVLAISLFFNGISLVFRTTIRWAILCGGFCFLLYGVLYMIGIPWTFS